MNQQPTRATPPLIFRRRIISLGIALIAMMSASVRADVASAVENPAKIFTQSTRPFSPNGWSEDATIRHVGSSSAKSGLSGDNQNSTLFNTFSGEGTLNFWWKVSCEENYDFLYFFVDGSPVPYATITGEQDWAQVSVVLGPGEHTVEWAYAKDISIANGADAGWVDGISFVPVAGDAAHHIDARVRAAFITRSTRVFTAEDPEQANFRGRALIDFQQLDEAALPPSDSILPVRMTWVAENADTNTVVANGEHDTTVALASHSGGANPLPGTALLPVDFNFTVGDPSVVDPPIPLLDPLTPFRLRVTARFIDPSGSSQDATGEVLSDNSRLLSLSGRLTAGGVEARFHEIFWSPSLTSSQPTGHLVEVDSAQDAVWLLADETFRFRLSSNQAYRNPITGDLDLQPGIPITFPDFTKTIEGVRTRGKNVTLSSTGFSAGEYRIYFPAGFAVMAPTVDYLLEKTSSGFAVLDNIQLGSDFIPLAPVTLTPTSVRRAVVPEPVNVGNLFFCSHERLPCWFLADSLVYDPGTGTFTTTTPFDAPWLHVRAVEKITLDGINPVPGHQRDFRPSNDSYFSRTWALGGPATSSFQITTNEQGIALLNAECPLGPATHAPHWPQSEAPSPAVPGFAFTGGTVTFTDNEIDPAASSLIGVNSVVQRYARDPVGTATCPDRADAGSFDFVPSGQQIALTADGGLLASGTLAAPENLSWGTVDKQGFGNTHRFAHSTADPFTNGTFYQPGYFLAGGLSARSGDDRPGTLLLTGRGDPGSSLTERPVAEDAGYFNTGAANYAGLNFRATPGQRGSSVIAGLSFGPYPLSASSRYSVHRGGVCGVHERATTTAPVELNLFGFNSTLRYFKLGWIDNVNETSVCEGGLVVPYPSEFIQAFEDLRFDQRGMPGPANLPANPAELHLKYWGEQPFTPLSFSFQPTLSDNPCVPPNSTSGFLEMAVRFPSLANQLIPGPIHGTLGFKGNGDLITAKDRRGGLAKGSTVDSRLILPPQFTISAPGGGSYRFQPLTRGYFNKYPGGLTAEAAGGKDGFISFAGKLGVPFFEALPVHVHVEPGQVDSGIHIMNGWEENGRTFFNDGDRFDDTHLGHPQVESLANYRVPPTEEKEKWYLPRARKNWLDTIDFNYPLRWKPGLHTFESPRPVTEDVVLFNLTHQCGYLTANGAEIKFGTEIATLPALNPQKLLLGALDGVSDSAFTQFDDALHVAIGAAADASQITKAFSSLDALLSDRLVDAMRPTAGAIPNDFISLDLALDQAILNLMPDVNAEISGLNYKTDLLSQIVDGSLTNPMKTALEANGLTKLATQRLDETIAGLTQIRSLVQVQGGQRLPFRRLVSELGKTDAGVSSAIQQNGAENGLSWLDSEMNRLELTPYLAEIETALNQLIQQVTSLKNSFGTTISEPTSRLLENNVFQTDMRDDVSAELERLLPNDLMITPGNTAQLNQIRTRLRAVLSDGFYASPAASRLSALLRQNLNGPRTIFRSLLDELLGQVRDSIKNAVLESGIDALGAVPEFKELKSANDKLAQSFGGANLRGYARTVGNSISTVRLDGSLKLAPPGTDLGIEASGYVEYKDYELLGPEPDCLNVGAVRAAKIGVAAGIRVGASGKPRRNGADINERGSSFDGMSVGVDVAFALNGDGVPIGFGGKMFFQGQANFGLVTVQRIEMTANFSEQNQFVIGFADGQVLQVLDVKAQIFVGNTCDFQRLGLLDEYTSRSLDAVGYPEANRQLMAGTVFKALGGISLNEILPIPREIVDIYLERGYTMLLLVAPDAAGTPIFNNPEFLLGASEYGRASVRLFERIKVADVECGYGGVLRANPAAIFDTVLNINGGAKFCGPCLDLGITEICLPCVKFSVQGEIRPLPAPPFTVFYLTGLGLD